MNYRESQEVLAALKLFGPETHSIEFREGRLRENLLNGRLIEWVPPIFGSSNQYAITEKGKAAIAILEHDIAEYEKDRQT